MDHFAIATVVIDLVAFGPFAIDLDVMEKISCHKSLYMTASITTRHGSGSVINEKPILSL